MEILLDSEIEDLDWKLHPNMVRIKTIADGSCFFHAIAKSYHKGYRDGEIGGKSINRSKMIRSMRSELAKKLGQKAPNSKKTYYQLLGKGEIEILSKENPEFSLDNLQKLLDSSRPVGNIFNEFVSNELKIDIYILDGKNKSVYRTSDDDKLLYKNRDSVVLLYIEDPGHYELVGLRDGDKIHTIFNPSHDFIKNIKKNS